MFNHIHYRNQFINNPGTNLALNYGVRVLAGPTLPDKKYFDCIGVYHLRGDENVGKHNIYVDILDKNNNRITQPFQLLGWTWEGKRPEEIANPVLLDKPNTEPAGNISVHWGQKIKIWVIGDSLNNPMTGDVVENLHSMHPDEDSGNTLGHHSFYVVFREAGSTPPDPVIPINWRKKLTEKELKHVEFSENYVKQFNHGAPGHLSYVVINKLAKMLDSTQ